jgi:hypothetical protein
MRSAVVLSLTSVAGMPSLLSQSAGADSRSTTMLLPRSSCGCWMLRMSSARAKTAVAPRAHGPAHMNIASRSGVRGMATVQWPGCCLTVSSARGSGMNC